MESILPIALKLCARSPSILSDVSMLCQCRIEQDWNGKHWLSWTSSVLPPRGICQATCATTCASQWVVFALACLPAMCVKWQEETVGNHLRDAKAKFWQGTIARFWKIMEDLYYILLLCFCLCKNSYGIWGLVLAILGPERSQSPEVAKLLGSKVSQGFKRMVADIWAVSTCSWNQKMEMLGSLELFGCHREAWAKTSRLLFFCSKQHQYPCGVQLAGFLCFLSVLQYCCFLCMN